MLPANEEQGLAGSFRDPHEGAVHFGGINDVSGRSLWPQLLQSQRESKVWPCRQKLRCTRAPSKTIFRSQSMAQATREQAAEVIKDMPFTAAREI